jgi:hypothetical protein
MKRVSGPMIVVIAIWVLAIIGIVVAAPRLWWFFTNFGVRDRILSCP